MQWSPRPMHPHPQTGLRAWATISGAHLTQRSSAFEARAVLCCGQRYTDARDTVSVTGDKSRKISSMFTHNALTDAKMVGSKRGRFEKKAPTQIYLLILTSNSHGIVPPRCRYSGRK
jgi:hypothetical protein